MRLNGKTAIITGAGKGIGAAIARRFAAEGAKLVICDLNKANIEALVEEIKKSGGNASGFIVDVTDRSAIDAMVKQALDEFGTIDILVNNAGVLKDVLLHKMAEEDWDTVMNVNMKGVFNMCQAVVKLMRDKGYGKIINISSAGRFGNVGQTNYSASKEAIVGFTRSLAKEAGGKGINVNAIAPGTIETDMYYNIPEHIRDIMKLITPLARPGKPEEVADLCLFLASDEASYITGQVIHCDGGIFMP
ncbi:MAG TPA: 3-oxoacyl-ACP reductase FabG [Syntrophomonadaceae bacterium]|nr:3-oxoacyl-ACP reductase FabG [Syntrophomonadaceae bacterium]HPR94069.1 3-oxoacyl-ACP reductase FabG [Syntrophomonadaceae bacterium]